MHVTGQDLRVIFFSCRIDDGIGNATLFHPSPHGTSCPRHLKIDRNKATPVADPGYHFVHEISVFAIEPFQFCNGHHGRDFGFRSLNDRKNPIITFPVLNPCPCVNDDNDINPLRGTRILLSPGICRNLREGSSAVL